jgi:hypothetical protein
MDRSMNRKAMLLAALTAALGLWFGFRGANQLMDYGDCLEAHGEAGPQVCDLALR